MARHEHAHEVLGLAIGLVAGDVNLVDVLVVEVADRALDEVALLVDQRRRDGGQRQLAHALPQPHQVFVVALDLDLGARGAGGAQDDAHPVRHLELGGDLLEALAVLGIGDLARDAAALAGVGHQHRIAAGEREIGGQRRALVAALFLDDLDQDDLAALDHFLDLVLAAGLARRPLGHVVERVAAAELLRLVLGRIRRRSRRLRRSASSSSAGLRASSPSPASSPAASGLGLDARPSGFVGLGLEGQGRGVARRQPRRSIRPRPGRSTRRRRARLH